MTHKIEPGPALDCRGRTGGADSHKFGLDRRNAFDSSQLIEPRERVAYLTAVRRDDETRPCALLQPKPGTVEAKAQFRRINRRCQPQRRTPSSHVGRSFRSLDRKYWKGFRSALSGRHNAVTLSADLQHGFALCRRCNHARLQYEACGPRASAKC